MRISYDDCTQLRLREALAPNAPGGAGLLSRLAAILYRWQARANQRRHLAEMDAHMIKDIGLSRADVEAETSKPFWRA